MSHPALTLPNLLTASRLALAPVVVWHIMQADTWGAVSYTHLTLPTIYSV